VNHPTRSPLGPRISAFLVLGAGLAGCLLLPGPGGSGEARAGEERKREVKRTFEISGPVEIENLAGRVTARLAPGSTTTITATVQAAARNETEAQKLLDALELRFVEANGGIRVEAHYPLDRHRTYRYPSRESGSWTTESTYHGKRVKITTRDEDDAVTLWVDFDLELARGVGLRGKEMAGSFDLTGIEGPVKVENGWGNMSFSGVNGPLSAVTGSGELSVKSHRGEVSLLTGSGNIVAEDIAGSIVAETGSGDVHVGKATGRLEVSAGSGNVLVRGAEAAVDIDTGSGDAHIQDVRGREVEVDTGSGSIRVDSPALFKGPAARARFETGSGDVILMIDEQASMLLDFASGSGRVESPQALAGLLERIGNRGAERYQIGAGESHVEVDTGSGDVVLRLAGN
jgi:hypothetical protein